MSSPFGDSFICKNYDLICIFYCRKTVRYNNRSPSAAQTFKGLLYLHFRLNVL